MNTTSRWRALLTGYALVLASMSFANAASQATQRTANMSDPLYPFVASKPQPALALKGAKPLNVMLSVRPLTLMAQYLIPPEYRQLWQLNSLVSADSTIHDYQLRPTDLQKLSQTQLLFWLGPQLEPSLSQLIARFDLREVRLNEQDSLEFLPLSDDMQALSLDDHSHHSSVDPHIWLSISQAPGLLRLFADEMEALLDDTARMQRLQWSKALVTAQRQGIRLRLKFALEQQRKLLQQLKVVKRSWTEPRYISFHNGFGYLDRDLKVQSLGFVVQNPEEGISPRRLQELKQYVQDQKVACLLLEPAAQGRQLEQMLAPVRVVELDPTAVTLPIGVDWVGYWEYNIERLQQCFGQGGPLEPAPARNTEQQQKKPPASRPAGGVDRIKQRLQTL